MPATVRDFTIARVGRTWRPRGVAGDLPRPRVVTASRGRWGKLWEVERWRAVAASLADEGAGSS
jgi:hypothetical protein